jgi:hypothetical protein
MGNGADLATARDEKVPCVVSDQNWQKDTMLAFFKIPQNCATIREIGVRGRT